VGQTLKSQETYTGQKRPKHITQKRSISVQKRPIHVDIPLYRLSDHKRHLHAKRDLCVRHKRDVCISKRNLYMSTYLFVSESENAARYVCMCVCACKCVYIFRSIEYVSFIGLCRSSPKVRMRLVIQVKRDQNITQKRSISVQKRPIHVDIPLHRLVIYVCACVRVVMYVCACVRVVM